jgi:hypothetical protein
LIPLFGRRLALSLMEPGLAVFAPSGFLELKIVLSNVDVVSC